MLGEMNNCKFKIFFFLFHFVEHMLMDDMNQLLDNWSSDL